MSKTTTQKTEMVDSASWNDDHAFFRPDLAPCWDHGTDPEAMMAEAREIMAATCPQCGHDGMLPLPFGHEMLRLCPACGIDLSAGEID